MTDITLVRPKGIRRWMQIHRIYRTSFPASERKPFSIIVNMYRKGKSDVWCILQKGKMAGLAVTINEEKVILLDYLAVDASHRGKGVGTGAMAALKQQYDGKGLFVEIESCFEDGSDQEARRRRKQFYLRCGLEPMNVMVRLFGVKMELLGWNCRLDFDRYKAFYRNNYSPWAAERITKESHPDSI